MTIISALPFNLTNGQTADATQVMADFSQIVTQVNAGALSLAGGTLAGPLILAADAVNPLQAVTLEQMQVAVAAASSGLLLNRIINGDFNVSQQYASGVTALTGSFAYYLDRWQAAKVPASTATVQQSGGQTLLPFTNCMLYTVVAGSAPGAGDAAGVRQKIEGINIYDAQFGQATAQPVTVTFSVNSSLLGTFSVALQNNAGTRSYAATYVVAAANTWTNFTITIPGDVTGVWLSGVNQAGLNLIFDLGSGSGFEGAAGAWTAGGITRTAASVKPSATTGATWAVGDVQVTVGSAGGAFNRRTYNQELALCQRYCWVVAGLPAGSAVSSGLLGGPIKFPMTMCKAPTFTNGSYAVGGGSAGTLNALITTVDAVTLNNSAANWTSPTNVQTTFTALAEL